MKAIVLTPDNIDSVISSESDNLVAVIFDAEFTNQKTIVEAAVSHLEKEISDPEFVLATCDAEQHHEIATKFEIISLPSLALIKRGKPIKKSTDFEPSRLLSFLNQEMKSSTSSNQAKADTKDRLTLYIESLIKSANIMIFMKGKPTQPRCGFSKQLVELMARNNLSFESFDILENEEVRQGLKEYSNWPTYPQVYANGEFIGGLDILKQLDESGELVETLKPQAATKAEGDN